MALRILVADDDALVSSALVTFVEADPGMDVVASAHDGQRAVELASRLHPDVVLMDMQMPVLDGVEATREVISRCPDTRVLALSSFATDRYVVAALRAGASGYVVKDTPPAELLTAIRRIAHGEEVISPIVVKHVLASVREDTPVRHTPDVVAKHLSAREREVITLLSAGRSNKEIADDLHLSEATVKTHLSRIMAKLGVRDRVQTVIRAYEWGIASPRLDDEL